MLNENVVITRADVTDAEMLTELSITTFVEAFAADNRKEDMDKYIADEMNVRKLTEELGERDNRFFIARLNGDVAGYAKIRTLKKPPQLQDKRAVELERIYVVKKYHDKKIGAALMNVCLDYALSNHFEIMWLGVWEHNYRAVNFYKKFGFEFFGSHEFKLGDDIQTDQLMKKEL